jgi:RNA polymerase sigma-70 factor (ECF subfamily)
LSYFPWQTANSRETALDSDPRATEDLSQPDSQTAADRCGGSTTPTEESLVARLQQGDQDVLGELFSLHRQRLRRLIEFRFDLRLRGRVDPSDVLQESFLDAAQRLPHFIQGPAVPVFVWLRQVAIQRLIEVHRRHLGAEKRSAHRERSVDVWASPSATSASLAFQLVSRLASPSDVLVRNELVAQLHQALELMDPIDREVLALRHFEELSNDETAAALGLQKSAASNRYVRALGRLKKLLENIPGFFDGLDQQGDANP